MSRTITALEIQQHDPERVSVYLDGEFAFGLPLVEAARLRQGQVLSDQEIAALRETDAAARAFDKAASLLARRPYSSAEIRRALENKKFAPAVIEEVLARMSHLDYINDRAFAGYWIENRERFRPLGPRALQYELRQKGIAEDIIEAALGDVDALDSARRAAQEQVRRLRGLARREFRSKLSAFLVRRGFGYDIVREVVENLIRELEDERPDTFADEETDEE